MKITASRLNNIITITIQDLTNRTNINRIYEIYRKTNSTEYSLYATTTSSLQTFDYEDELEPDDYNVYTYKVRSVDGFDGTGLFHAIKSFQDYISVDNVSSIDMLNMFISQYINETFTYLFSGGGEVEENLKDIKELIKKIKMFYGIKGLKSSYYYFAGLLLPIFLKQNGVTEFVSENGEPITFEVLDYSDYINGLKDWSSMTSVEQEKFEKYRNEIMQMNHRFKYMLIVNGNIPVVLDPKKDFFGILKLILHPAGYLMINHVNQRYEEISNYSMSDTFVSEKTIAFEDRNNMTARRYKVYSNTPQINYNDDDLLYIGNPNNMESIVISMQTQPEPDFTVYYYYGNTGLGIEEVIPPS